MMRFGSVWFDKRRASVHLHFYCHRECLGEAALSGKSCRGPPRIDDIATCSRFLVTGYPVNGSVVEGNVLAVGLNAFHHDVAVRMVTEQFLYIEIDTIDIVATAVDGEGIGTVRAVFDKDVVALLEGPTRVKEVQTTFVGRCRTEM